MREHREEAGVTTDRISVSVEADVAQAYPSTSDGDRRKLDRRVNWRSRGATRHREPRRDFRGESSRDARRSGCMSEIVRSILDA